MKNSFILFILLIIGSSLHGQTDSIEKAVLYNKVLSNELPAEDFSKIGKKWNETITKINKYPELPFDQNGQVYYSFVNEFKNMPKEKLFNRILEWLTINYGIIPPYLYSNLDDGKIIFKNNFNLNANFTCNYTSIITIKNEKILFEFEEIGYQEFFAGHYTDEIWIADKTIDVGLKDIYPIILKKPSEWDSYLNLLKTTNEHFYSEIDNMSNYIINYDVSYKF